MFNALIAILSLLLTICIIVGVHEFGHFMMARFFNVKVLRFSLGFGKVLFRCHDRSGTEYALSAIPLGGYVKMLNEDEDDIHPEDKHLAYNNKPYYQKFLIIIAGPLMNLLLALLIYWCLFYVGFNSIKPMIGVITPNSIAGVAKMQPNQEITQIDNQDAASWMSVIVKLLNHAGDKDTVTITTNKGDYQLDLANWEMDALKPDPLSSLGITPYSPPVKPIIEEIEIGSPAADAKLQKNDVILAVNQIPVREWGDLIKYVSVRPNQQVTLSIQRGNQKIQQLVLVSTKRDALFRGRGFIGIRPYVDLPENLVKLNKYNLPTAFQKAAANVWMMTQLNFMMLKKLVLGKISLKSLGGPISIYESAGTSLNNGVIPFFSFIAFLSISIGIINILPIPGLDGGHLLLETIAAITRRPISMPIQILMFKLGIIFILLIMTQAVVNDVLRF